MRSNVRWRWQMKEQRQASRSVFVFAASSIMLLACSSGKDPERDATSFNAADVSGRGFDEARTVGLKGESDAGATWDWWFQKSNGWVDPRLLEAVPLDQEKALIAAGWKG
jgi:hypothetical protein